MHEYISEDHDPNGKPRFHLQDGTVFIYNTFSGVYEPHQKTAGSANTDPVGVLEKDRSLRIVVDRDNLTFIVSVLTLIAVAAYTYFAFQQVGAAIEASKAATTSLADSRRSVALDERAWISVTDVVSGPRGNNSGASIILENKGRTPAKSFVVLAAAGDTGGEEEHPLSGSGVIAPGGTFHSNVVSGRSPLHKGSLYVHGTIRYYSVFGKEHWTKFCYHQVATSRNFESCKTGNDIDVNEP